MNLLVDKLPQDYEGLKINTNFRSFILFELLMQDRDYTPEEKIQLTLNLFYEDPVEDIKKAIDGVLWMYKRGKDEKISKKKETGQKKQIYSYEYDAGLIFSAFYDQYGIDLNEIDYLHWWKFKSLFEGLKSDNRIVEIMGYRAINVSKIKNKEEQKRYKKLQQEYALPDMRTEKEKENDFAEAFW